MIYIKGVEREMVLYHNKTKDTIMRTLHHLGYGQKSMVVINNDTKKTIDFKMNIGGVCSVVVSRYTKGQCYGWDKLSSYTTTLYNTMGD